jgi:hypothetical protein
MKIFLKEFGNVKDKTMKAFIKGALTSVFEQAKRVVSKGFDLAKAGLEAIRDHFRISPEDRDFLAADGMCPMGGDIPPEQQRAAQARINKRHGL